MNAKRKGSDMKIAAAKNTIKTLALFIQHVLSENSLDCRVCPLYGVCDNPNSDELCLWNNINEELLNDLIDI